MKMNRGMHSLTSMITIALMFSLVTAALAHGADEFETAPPIVKVLPTHELGQATDVDARVFGARADAVPSTAVTPTAMDLKVLVICGDGSESSLPAIKQALTVNGTPFDVYTAGKTPGGMTLAKLQTGSRALYNAIILTTPDAGYFNSTTNQWTVGLSATEKAVLASYEAVCKVNQVTWYSFPNAELGYTGNPTAVDTSASPLKVSYTKNGASVFFYTNTTAGLTIQNAYTYLAKPATDGNSFPLLQDAAGNALALIRRYPDGRFNLAMTFDSNQFLLHQLVLSYGVLNWACKGLFLGKKRVYQSAQVDDIGLPSDTGSGLLPGAPNYRMTGADLDALTTWQNGVRNNPLTSDYALSMAYNGAGFIKPELSPGQTSDTLRTRIPANQANYYWISHTLTHPDEQPVSLENTAATIPYPTVNGGVQNIPNSTFCAYQVYYNTLFGQGYTIPLPGGFGSGPGLNLSGYRGKSGTVVGNSNANIVTPAISGLKNPYFLSTYYVYGGRNLVGDTSTPTKTRTDGAPNVGFMINLNTPALTRSNIVDTTIAQVLVQPRYPTNLFYGADTPARWTAQYNAVYRSFFGRDSTYAEIIDRESTALVNYMVMGSNFTLMFHQANLAAYDKKNCVLGDLLNAAFVKYGKLFALPVKCLTMDQIGNEMRARMQCDASGMSATLNYNASGAPTSLQVRCTKAATVPLTGLYGEALTPEQYGSAQGSQWTSNIPVGNNSTVTINLK